MKWPEPTLTPRDLASLRWSHLPVEFAAVCLERADFVGDLTASLEDLKGRSRWAYDDADHERVKAFVARWHWDYHDVDRAPSAIKCWLFSGLDPSSLPEFFCFLPHPRGALSDLKPNAPWPRRHTRDMPGHTLIRMFVDSMPAALASYLVDGAAALRDNDRGHLRCLRDRQFGADWNAIVRTHYHPLVVDKSGLRSRRRTIQNACNELAAELAFDLR